MRKNIKNAATNINSNIEKFHRKRRNWLMLASNLIILLVIGLWVTPDIIDQRRMDAEVRAIVHQMQEKRRADLAESVRQKAEDAVMAEYYCLANTLFWEAERGNAVDHQAIADVVFSRVASKRYPDTICDVTQEVRQNHKGQNVAMFSYIFDIADKPAPSGASWKFSRRQAAIAFKDYLDGKQPSGNLNYHAGYVSPLWKTVDVAECKLRPVAIEGAFHHFYAPVEAKDRNACLEQRRQTALEVAHKGKFDLPKTVPLPSPRPI